MAILKKDQFEKLANHHDAHCVSFFMPTERYGMEVNQGKDKKVFEKHLRAVRTELEKRGLTAREIESFLKSARELTEDLTLWRNLSDGLAVFISDEFFEYYTLPLRFENYLYLSDHFYLKPLMPLFNGNGRFFLLGLTLHGAQFYEGTRYSLTEVFVEDLLPERLEEVVGYDYEESFLQFRTQSGLNTGAQFHGQGIANDKRKEEVLQYCRAVDKGLLEMLHDEDVPMVVACVDFLFPLYKQANKYKHLMDEHISGNPEPIELTLLHERAWDIVSPEFQAVEKEKIEKYHTLSATDRSSYQVEDIVPAAVYGKIDALFLQNRADVFGTFNPANNTVELDEEKDLSNASLMNLAAVKTFLQNGKVFLREPEDMPEEDTLMNAVFRY